jgi:hypothetical protein
MKARAGFRLVTIAFGCVVTALAARPAESQMSQQSPSLAADLQAQAELGRMIAGLSSDTSSHMRMGPTRTATIADSARALAIVRAARTALSQYVDVKVAERDGYYRNLPGLEDLPIYHYNSLPNFNAAAGGEFDLTKPVSLLYKKDAQGQLRLVGAMYATSAAAAPTRLDSLLPISMAHWHEHVNMCYPYRGPRKLDASAVFWLKLYFSITSASECAAAGGQFLPSEAGWMAHVYMFSGSDDPKAIWDVDDVGNMETHMPHHEAGLRK